MFSDADREKSQHINFEAPEWDYIDHLLNPTTLPSSQKLKPRELFVSKECVNSSCEALNLSLLKSLKQCVSDIHTFEKFFPLEQDKHIKKFHHRTAFCRWLASARNEEMVQICSGNFILIKPFDEESLIHWVPDNQHEVLPIPSSFALNYWLTAWRWSASYPLNTEIVFGLSRRLVEQLHDMDTETILAFAQSRNANRFQLRHNSTILELLKKYVVVPNQHGGG